LDKKTNIVFVSGCAGTSKTHTAVYAGLKALNSKTQSDILYLRSAIESASKSLGALPGDAGSKIEVYLLPLHDKLEEMLPKNEIDALTKEKRIEGNVVNYIRGASWNAKFVIVDEAQNLTKEELKTILSRMGRHSKLVICGDPGQSDLKDKSGFLPLFDLFNEPESKDYGIHCFGFTREDIVRSKILGYILDKIEGVYHPPQGQ
jgi:phosphate starvation-inducible PhoH-like protein